MKYLEFLETVRVIRMLYSVDNARMYFEKNVNMFYKNNFDPKEMLINNQKGET
jgi:hypothetical protein